MLQGTCIRETRTAAREIKFLVSLEQSARVLEWARTRLAPDPYAGGDTGDEYQTTTVYFDTEAFDVYHRQRSYARSKHRIRQYGSATEVFLERKLRTITMLSKRRMLVPKVELERLLEPSLDASWSGYWFARRLRSRSVSPVCQVTYHRHARVGAGPYGPMRLTFDNGIMVQPSHSIELVAPAGIPVLATHGIIEMKYCREIPSVFKQLVENFGLSPDRISKYRLSLDTLKQAGIRTGVHHVDLTDVLKAIDTDAAPGLVNA